MWLKSSHYNYMKQPSTIQQRSMSSHMITINQSQGNDPNCTSQGHLTKLKNSQWNIKCNFALKNLAHVHSLPWREQMGMMVNILTLLTDPRKIGVNKRDALGKTIERSYERWLQVFKAEMLWDNQSSRVRKPYLGELLNKWLLFSRDQISCEIS